MESAAIWRSVVRHGKLWLSETTHNADIYAMIFEAHEPLPARTIEIQLCADIIKKRDENVPLGYIYFPALSRSDDKVSW
jgi:hypothetical protein